MHGERKILWSFLGILVVCAAAAWPIRHMTELDASRGGSRLRNLANAARIEVHDRLTERVLLGEFRTLSGSSSEVLNEAPLMAAAGEAVGRAEIELVRHPNGVLVQEIEVDVAGLPADATFDVSVDGEWLGAFHTDRYGGAEFEQFGRIIEAAKFGD